MIPDQLKVHSATVKPYVGSGAYGDRYGDPVTVAGYYEGRRQLVRDASGSEAVSEGTFYTDPVGTEQTLLDGTTVTVPEIPAGSQVTVLGRKTHAITVTPLDDGGLTGLAHQEVALA